MASPSSITVSLHLSIAVNDQRGIARWRLWTLGRIARVLGVPLRVDTENEIWLIKRTAYDEGRIAGRQGITDESPS